MDATQNRPIGALFSDLGRQIGTLIHEEVALAKAEMKQTTQKATKDVALLVVAALLGLGGYLTLLAFIVIGLYALGVSLWLSALLVGIVFAAGGGLIAMQALDGLRNLDMVPHATVDSMKENVKWAREQIA